MTKSTSWLNAYLLPIVLFCLFSSCSVLRKSKDLGKFSMDSTVEQTVEQQTKTEKIETATGDYNVQFDGSLPCANIVNYNANTGVLQASGSVKGVSIQNRKEAKERAENKARYYNINHYTKQVITKHETKTKSYVPWWIYAIIGVLVAALLVSYWAKYKTVFGRVFTLLKGWFTGV